MIFYLNKEYYIYIFFTFSIITLILIETSYYRLLVKRILSILNKYGERLPNFATLKGDSGEFLKNNYLKIFNNQVNKIDDDFTFSYSNENENPILKNKCLAGYINIIPSIITLFAVYIYILGEISCANCFISKISAVLIIIVGLILTVGLLYENNISNTRYFNKTYILLENMVEYEKKVLSQDDKDNSENNIKLINEIKIKLPKSFRRSRNYLYISFTSLLVFGFLIIINNYYLQNVCNCM